MDTEALLSLYYELLAARDQEGLRQLLAPDVVVTYHAQRDQLPWAGTFHGHAGFDEFLKLVSQHVEIVDADRLPPIIANDHAIVRTQGRWRVDATDKIVSGSMINVFTMSAGTIVAYEVWADTAAFVEGLRPD